MCDVVTMGFVAIVSGEEKRNGLVTVGLQKAML